MIRNALEVHQQLLRKTSPIQSVVKRARLFVLRTLICAVISIRLLSENTTVCVCVCVCVCVWRKREILTGFVSA